MGENSLNLPPGFRFYPTDEELVVHFLHRKAALLPCHPDVIPDLGLFPYDPWDLDGKAMREGKKWYMYSRGCESRISLSGYWQNIGVEEPIFSSNGGHKIGMKKMSAFFIGEPWKGVRTNWVMHEFCVSSSSTRTNPRIDYNNKWVVCRVHEYGDEEAEEEEEDGIELSCLDEVFLSLDDHEEISFPS